jgi:hypothetical protein
VTLKHGVGVVASTAASARQSHMTKCMTPQQ